MSKTLKFSRLSLLLSNHVVENRQKYLLYTVGMFFLGLIVFLLIYSMENFHGRYYNPDTTSHDYVYMYSKFTEWETIQMVLYLIGLFLFGGIFASISFVNFSNTAESIFYMNKPASYLEKWLAEFLVRIFLFFIIYNIIFSILNIPFTFLVRAQEWHNIREAPLAGEYYYVSRILYAYLFTAGEHEIYWGICSGYFSVVGFFMYGAAWFNRFSFFKTLILAFVIGAIFAFYALVLDNILTLPTGWHYDFPFSASLYEDDGLKYEASFSTTTLLIILYGLLFFVPIVLMYCSYLKLKEKEI